MDKDLAVAVIAVPRRQQLISHRRHMVRTSTTRPAPNINHLARLANKASAVIPQAITILHPTVKVGTVLQTHHRHRNTANRVRLRTITGNTTRLSPGCLVPMTINPHKPVMVSNTSHTITNLVDSKIPLTLAPQAGNTAHQILVHPATPNKTLHIPHTLRTPTIVPTPAKVSSINILLNTIRHIQASQGVTTLIAPRPQYLPTPANRAVYQVVIHRRLTVILDMATKDKEDKDMGSRAHLTEGLGLLLHRDGGPDIAIRMTFG